MDNVSDETLVVAVSARSLFDLEEDHQFFEKYGAKRYIERQLELESVPFKQGATFPLVRGLLDMNNGRPEGSGLLVEVVVVSSMPPDTGLRIIQTAKHHNLTIRRAAFTGGGDSIPYLHAFNTKLFLTKSAKDAQRAINSGIASAVMSNVPENIEQKNDGIVRIAFDGDAVIFSDESEKINQTSGVRAFNDHEAGKARVPMQFGPHGELLVALGKLQKLIPEKLRIALVTARGGPAHERTLVTLRSWGIRINEAAFLGGLPKTEFLRAFGAQIFFDDQQKNIEKASRFVPSGHVPSRSGRIEKPEINKELISEITEKTVVDLNGLDKTQENYHGFRGRRP